MSLKQVLRGQNPREIAAALFDLGLIDSVREELDNFSRSRFDYMIIITKVNDPMKVAAKVALVWRNLNFEPQLSYADIKKICENPPFVLLGVGFGSSQRIVQDIATVPDFISYYHREDVPEGGLPTVLKDILSYVEYVPIPECVRSVESLMQDRSEFCNGDVILFNLEFFTKYFEERDHDQTDKEVLAWAFPALQK